MVRSGTATRTVGSLSPLSTLGPLWHFLVYHLPYYRQTSKLICDFIWHPVFTLTKAFILWPIFVVERNHKLDTAGFDHG